MNNLRKSARIGIVFSMAYPEVAQGDGPVLERLQHLLADDYFDVIDQVPVHAEDNYQLIAGYLVVPEQEAAKLPMIQKIPLVRTSGEKVIADAKQMRNAIFSPYSGKIVADFPISYRKTGFGPGLYHAKRLGNNVVLAGFTSLNAAKRQYIWHTYQAKTKKWQPTQRKLDTEALVRQLPKQFAFATVDHSAPGNDRSL